MTKKPALNWETRTRTVEVKEAFDVAEIRMTEDEVAEIIQRHIRARHMLPIDDGLPTAAGRDLRKGLRKVQVPPEHRAFGIEPVVYVSSKQLPHNPEHAYIACRLHPEGNFDTPLYAVASPDEESLWRFWNEKARKLAAELDTLRPAVQGIDDDYMTSENHHPGYVLIPTAKFEAIRAALSATATEGE